MDATTSSWPPHPAIAIPTPPDWREIAHQAVQNHRAIQHSTELSLLLAMADDRQVRTVLEIGTSAGGSAWAFGQLPSVQTIVTVDSCPQAEAYSQIAALAPKASMIKAEAEYLGCAEAVREHLAGNMADLLFIDGGSDVDTVKADWRIYGPMVRPGGLAVLANVELPYDRPSSGQSLVWAKIRTAWPSLKISAAPGQWAGYGVIFL